MKFDLKHFKKLSSDKSMTTLQHPDGHTIKIAHQHLTPKMRGQLASLPEVEKMAEGGQVANETPSFDDQVLREQYRLGRQSGLPLGVPGINPDINLMKTQAETNVAERQLVDKENQAFSAEDDYKKQLAKVQHDNQIRLAAQLPPIPVPEMPAEMANLPVASQEPAPTPQVMPQQQAASPVGQDPYGTQSMEQYYGRGLSQQKAGIMGQAQAASEQAALEQQALAHAQEQQIAITDLYNQHVAKLNGEREAIFADAKAGHIDPNKFWADRSAPQKISSIIGLVLGGLGAGALRQENPVMKMLNNEIERNINAQKSDLENKHNLLNANRAQFQNEHDAANMTRIMLNDQLVNGLKMAAAKTTDPQAKARALQAAGALDMQAAPIMSQLAMRRAVLSGSSAGALDPSMTIRVIVPEHQQAAAYKELGEAQNMRKFSDNILSAFDQINKINTVGNRMSSPLQTSRQVAAIRDPLVATLSKETAGRFTEADAAYLASLFPGVGDDPATIKTKRARLNSLITEKMHFPVLNSYGINPGNAGRFNKQGQSKIQESAPVIK